MLFAATLFTLQLGGLVLIYTASVALFMAVRWRAAGPALTRCAPILVLPFYAIASTLWSVAPTTTLYYGTEYLVTVVAAILIGAATGGRSALKGMFAAFFLWALLNLLAAQEAERGTAGAVRENRLISDLLGSAPAYAVVVPDPTNDPSPAAIDAHNAALRRALITLHEAAEQRGDDATEARILALYAAMAEGRKLILPPLPG